MWNVIDEIKKSNEIISKSDETDNRYYIDAELYYKSITTEVCNSIKTDGK